MGGRPMPKPQAACTLTVADGMVVKTQLTSPVAEKAQGVMELLLINHPLDCPICDKGGECPLQNQTLATAARTPGARPEAGVRQADRDLHADPAGPRALRAVPALHPVLRADRRRQVHRPAGTRRAQQIGINSAEPFQSYFSGNTIQICPVGALTSAAYRFRARPFDLVSTPERVRALRARLRAAHRLPRGAVIRRLAGNDPEVNEEWNCDKGRFAFRYVAAGDRITRPLVRGADGVLRQASWTEAMRVAAEGCSRRATTAGSGCCPAAG